MRPPALLHGGQLFLQILLLRLRLRLGGGLLLLKLLQLSLELWDLDLKFLLGGLCLSQPLLCLRQVGINLVLLGPQLGQGLFVGARRLGSGNLRGQLLGGRTELCHLALQLGRGDPGLVQPGLCLFKARLQLGYAAIQLSQPHVYLRKAIAYLRLGTLQRRLCAGQVTDLHALVLQLV